MRFDLSPASPAGKWLCFVTAVWVQAISGNNYSDALKSLMALTQHQLNNLSLAKAFSILAGLAFYRLSTPVILLIGSVEGFIGYGVQWLVVSRRIQPLPYWAMSIFLCMGWNSTTWMNTAVLVTCSRNFRQNWGPVSGILKGYVGLTTDICSAVFADDPAKFLLMLAITPFFVCLAAVAFLRETPPSSTAADERDETKYFAVIKVLAVIIKLHLFSFNVSGAHGRVYSQIFAAVFLSLLASPISIPIYLAAKNFIRSESNTVVDVDENVTAPLLAAEGEMKAETTSSAVKRRRPVVGEEHTVFEALRSVDFWILFVSFLCGVGTGLAVMNNLGQMGFALGYTDISIFDLLTSFGGFLGRIFSGSITEYFIKKSGTPRPVWNAASQVVMAVVYIHMAMAVPGSLYVGSIVFSICYGVRLAITIPTASELFGLKHYGTIYNILILNLPLGSFLFSGLLVGFLYDAEATSTAGGGNTCIRPHCYMLVFVVMAIVCVIGFGLDILLYIRTKSIYSNIYASRGSKKHSVVDNASSLGSMASIAISYGENGAVFCGLKSDGSHLANCYGSNPAIIHATPKDSTFIGLTGGSGFVCGLQMISNKPFCWGGTGFIPMGVPLKIGKFSEYLEISAGDNHLCGLRKPLMGRFRNTSLVDCWGYNMTKSYNFDGQIQSISAGSEFNCALFAQNRSVFCWGDQTSSNVIELIPKELRFTKIAAGGFHVCGILEGVSARVVCWGTSLDLEEEISVGSVVYSGQLNVDLAPNDAMLSVVGGRFHACGIRTYDRGVVCWGYKVEKSTPPPNGVKLYEIAAGDYFTCGILAETSLSPVCWGANFPSSLPLAISPGICKETPCLSGFYEFDNASAPCKSSGSHICLPCSNGCPNEMYQVTECSLTLDRQCGYNCSSCRSSECITSCSNAVGNTNENFWSVHLPIIIAEVLFAVFLVIAVLLASVLYVRYKLRNCRCSVESTKSSTFDKESGKVRPELDEVKIRRAQKYTYEELERATNGFKEEVGKGSFSCVFKGVLKDGTTVAVKRAIVSADMKKNSKEFHTELDLLSRLNHAHLLNLLGYCEEGGERLLVYEFMANGSLHQHLHCKNKEVKEQLDWIKRVTIAVQAARGIEYLHGYACPPVIHRDIKSSNILIDEEHNARVADFGLSLLGPANSSSPLAELPAGTLGYLDPEYYRLHYLTTKSDVYSFGVLLLEILSGRKAIDMNYEEGNIVEWAVPLIKGGEIEAILDPVLKPPNDIESLKRIANIACKCVRMRGKERPSMDKVTTALERGLALLMGSPCNEQPILPTEVVLGSSRMHKKSSQRYGNRSNSETDEDQRIEFRAPSWITFPSVASSQRRRSSVSELDIDGKTLESSRNVGGGPGVGDGLRSLVEEIGPASPQEHLYLQHNF
ncbi:hypothetical protein BUALT_Bualt15G0011000 [Buddleja alternifolia]|uniref:non-specific serine/threonine protein kinase n=1 Tax=Buddleja alternifolia TaxID=168488 RepID=A0AAV6WDF3_9LAMI|nr:hypothetical protein BUALT_Bualt15G0011000 [Buddleja alternifolia]